MALSNYPYAGKNCRIDGLKRNSHGGFNIVEPRKPNIFLTRYPHDPLRLTKCDMCDRPALYFTLRRLPAHPQRNNLCQEHAEYIAWCYDIPIPKANP